MFEQLTKQQLDHMLLKFYGLWPWSWLRISEDHESVTFMLKKDNNIRITLRW